MSRYAQSSVSQSAGMDRAGAAGEFVMLVLGRESGFSGAGRSEGLVLEATAAHARVPLVGSVVEDRAGDADALVLVCNFPREGAET